MYMTARVVENRRLARGNFVLRLSLPDGGVALRNAVPGQFVMVRGEWGRDPLLPRAFSILRTVDGGCELLVKAIGRGTRLFELAQPGAPLSVLGPLGKPFAAPEPGRTDLLVAGGVGLAPLLWHAEVAAKTSCATPMHLFYGARTHEDLVLLDDIARTGVMQHLATEDGSRGLHGRVTIALEQHLATKSDRAGTTILTCGPNAMMRAVVDIARKYEVPCLVSVEGEMACGIGACLGCALPLTDGSRPFAYACVDGPVFDAARVVIP
ncbi:MAG: dihydroorotate oxidase electron transfer subunit [Myxococcales bacterium]|nr:dihydroorotate oxidase electron transfer subunit [Myxococcales bacterium]